jgi:ABC-type sugar transport system ATPase subunit
VLDLALDRVALRRGDLTIRDLTASFPAGSHTALVGATGSGKSTVLALLEGSLRPVSGRVLIGQRDATPLKPAARPVLHSLRTEAIPGRRTVKHVLIAAARSRKGLDYEDRMAEIERAAQAWSLTPLLDRRARDLSPGERLRVRLAQILLLRPAVLLAERLFEPATAGTALEVEDRFWRQLRADGCTVVHEVARTEEIGWADRAALIDDGLLAASGSPREVERLAPTPRLASLFGPSSLVPVTIVGDEVRSAIGTWTLDAPPFQGNGIAVASAWHFTPAAAGQESDFLLGIEEARFLGWAWELTGMVSGATLLRVWAGPDERLARGKILPIRMEPSRFRLFPAAEAPVLGAPTDVIPPRSESR